MTRISLYTYEYIFRRCHSLHCARPLHPSATNGGSYLNVLLRVGYARLLEGAVELTLLLVRVDLDATRATGGVTLLLRRGGQDIIDFTWSEATSVPDLRP